MLRAVFQKTGRARYISHLDLMRTFQRALFRAEIPVWHTEGFHTHAYVSIILPLSVGYSSDCEVLEFRVDEGYDPSGIPAALNAALPEGITVLSCAEGEQPAKRLAWVRYRMELAYPDGNAATAAEQLAPFFTQKELVMKKRSKKAKAGFTEVDLIPLIGAMDYQPAGETLVIHALLRAQNPGLNPELMMTAIREHLPDCAPATARFHRIEVLNEEKEPFQ